MWECDYCHKTYVREDAYMNHKCKQMIRAEEIQTPLGQAAYSYYCEWMKLNKRRAPQIDVFTTSRFYTYFVNFAHYVKHVKIPDTTAFITLMVNRDLSPSLWRHDNVYVMYIEYIDRNVKPLTQAKNTIETIFKVADAAECDPSDIFNQLETNEVIQLIRERRLSPWILMFSGKFKLLVANGTQEQREIFEALIRPMYWKLKFDKHPEAVKYMKRYVKELDL